MQPQNIEDDQKPIAYTPEGQPLYAHPPTPEDVAKTATVDASAQPQIVYLTRAIEPHQQEISEETKHRHEQSVRRYPHLNLSDGEYVISDIRRHPIGIVSIWLVIAAMIAVVFIGTFMLLSMDALPFRLSAQAVVSGSLVLLLFAALLVVGGVVSTIVYNANRFYLTNESVIQQTQISLFSKESQTISLGNVEDASFVQHGVIQTFLDYGSIRLSTEGEETTYRFSYVSEPQKQIDLLNNAVEAFKNFRPIDADED